jgi:hypothetical protein
MLSRWKGTWLPWNRSATSVALLTAEDAARLPVSSDFCAEEDENVPEKTTLNWGVLPIFFRRHRLL